MLLFKAKADVVYLSATKINERKFQISIFEASFVFSLLNVIKQSLIFMAIYTKSLLN